MSARFGYVLVLECDNGAECKNPEGTAKLTACNKNGRHAARKAVRKGWQFSITKGTAVCPHCTGHKS